MKYLFFILCLFPLPALASMLADCDDAPYDVTVRNGGSERVVTVSRFGGNILEFGPVVSYQLKGQPPMVVTVPDEEFCIWHGKIAVQRLNTGSSAASGGFPPR